MKQDRILAGGIKSGPDSKSREGMRADAWDIVRQLTSFQPRRMQCMQGRSPPVSSWRVYARTSDASDGISWTSWQRAAREAGVAMLNVTDLRRVDLGHGVKQVGARPCTHDWLEIIVLHCWQMHVDTKSCTMTLRKLSILGRGVCLLPPEAPSCCYRLFLRRCINFRPRLFHSIAELHETPIWPGYASWRQLEH